MTTSPIVSVPVLGIDVGGVLVKRASQRDDTSFFGVRPMETPMVAGALEAVRLLAPLFGFRVHLVSKAGPRIAALTKEWLALHGFFEDTGLDAGSMWFVRKREDKAPICARLGVTHFVDDRVDVLEYLTSVSFRFLFTGGLGDHPAPLHPPARFRVSGSWSSLGEAIAVTLGEGRHTG